MQQETKAAKRKDINVYHKLHDHESVLTNAMNTGKIPLPAVIKAPIDRQSSWFFKPMSDYYEGVGGVHCWCGAVRMECVRVLATL